MSARKIVGIQLDLKYTMPSKRYLLEWVKQLPEFGINTLYIEYEDKFPYEKYPFLRDKEAFTPDQLRQFLAAARGADLTVMPLVQTLSHLEFALDHQQLAHLRECPHIPTMICPSKPEAVEFVRELVREVLAYHREDEFFHLGGDEAWHLGSCDVCKVWKEKAGPAGMWIEHQKKIMPVVLEAGKRPIYWDDIFWQKPELVIDSGLPKKMMLHAWNYGISSLAAGSGDETDLELGGKANALRQVDVYHKAGYECFAGPCCNIGVLAPNPDQALKNTMAWAQKMALSNMRGMMQTAWSCFHVPLPILNLTIAGTGLLSANPKADFGPAWQNEFLSRWFGAKTTQAAEALHGLSQNMSVQLPPEYGRSFGPIVYNYMNMVLHYPGRQHERRCRGAYPLHWEEVDFVAMYRKGVDYAKAPSQIAEVRNKAQALLKTYADAIPPFKQLADAATKHREEAQLMHYFAQMKHTSTAVFLHLLDGQGDPAPLRKELADQLAALPKMLGPFMEPGSIARMGRVWLEPQFAAMGGKR